MKRKRFSEEQIIRVMREAQAGEKVSEICRKHGISSGTYYNWKAKYAGMTISDLKKLKALEEENRKLKRIVADLTLDNVSLKDLVAKNF